VTLSSVDPAYLTAVLALYRSTIGTTGLVRSSDRRLAAELYQRGVSLQTIEHAFLLATLRRLVRPRDKEPLPTVRSLAYYQGVIDELKAAPLDPTYASYLRRKLERTLRGDDGLPNPALSTAR
jgi:hypothetical protein